MEVKTLQAKDVPLFSLKGMRVAAKVVDVYDGDTFQAIFEWRGTPCRFSCRLQGVDAPELRIPLNDPNRQQLVEQARASRKRLCQLLTGGHDTPDHHTHLIELTLGDWDKYGRLLVQAGDVADRLIQEGFCRPYDGGKRL